MSEQTTLFEEVSPNGNITAIVEQDGRVAYFYLWPAKETGLQVRSCWIRNLAPAPDDLDAAAMRDGRPPMMPRQYCVEPEGGSPLEATLLRIVWSEEGDAAALYEDDELLVAIPSWSGTDGFYGFSRDCIGEGPLAWALGTPESNVLFERFERAADYWRSWDEKGLWPNYRDRMLQSLESAFGKHLKYFAIDGDKWPPRALVQFNVADRIFLTTIGMSLRSQPSVEMNVEEPRNCCRIELGACLPSTVGAVEIRAVAQYVSGQSAFPWNFYTWLGNGHTLPADAFAELSSGRFPFALLSNCLPGVPQIQLPDFRDDPVSLLWMPISKKEQAFAESNDSQSLMRRLIEANSSSITSFARLPLQML